MTTYTVSCKKPDGLGTLIGPFWEKAEAMRELKRRKGSGRYTSVELCENKTP